MHNWHIQFENGTQAPEFLNPGHPALKSTKPGMEPQGLILIPYPIGSDSENALLSLMETAASALGLFFQRNHPNQ
jgi:hypothetical protein